MTYHQGKGKDFRLWQTERREIGFIFRHTQDVGRVFLVREHLLNQFALTCVDDVHFAPLKECDFINSATRQDVAIVELGQHGCPGHSDKVL